MLEWLRDIAVLVTGAGGIKLAELTYKFIINRKRVKSETNKQDVQTDAERRQQARTDQEFQALQYQKQVQSIGEDYENRISRLKEDIEEKRGQRKEEIKEQNNRIARLERDMQAVQEEHRECQQEAARQSAEIELLKTDKSRLISKVEYLESENTRLSEVVAGLQKLVEGGP